MKIQRLDLIAYGPFTDLSLDLSEGHEGLHLIYGPNEAGKSSALRAIQALFYGIGGQTPDDFLHPYKALRIGAVLKNRQGETLEFRRRKANKQTLYAADDETPLDPAELDRFLGRVDSKSFQTLFGIDHKRLVEGGQAIVEGRGQVGELLFSTSAGLTGLRASTDAIRKDRESLFKPRGQNQAINALLSELDALRKQVQQNQLVDEVWARHESDLRQAEQSKERLDRDWHDHNREKGRLSRIGGSLKLIARREELRIELGGYREVVPLPRISERGTRPSATP